MEQRHTGQPHWQKNTVSDSQPFAVVLQTAPYSCAGGNVAGIPVLHFLGPTVLEAGVWVGYPDLETTPWRWRSNCGETLRIAMELFGDLRPQAVVLKEIIEAPERS
jgi:hypothetical protein